MLFICISAVWSGGGGTIGARVPLEFYEFDDCLIAGDFLDDIIIYYMQS